MSGAADKRYRLVLTGELRPGADRRTALHHMAQLFSASEDALAQLLDGTQHTVDQEFSADEALDIQHDLERHGVLSRVERVVSNKVDLRLRPRAGAAPAAEPPGQMHCPACGHRQPVAARCSACGVDFEQFNRQRRQPPPAPPPPPGRPMPATPAGERWKPSREDLVDEVPSEEVELRLFIGRRARRYIGVFQRYGSSLRPQFAVGWNWSTFVSPFLWTLHRKLWLWAPLALVTEVLLPLLVLILATRGILPPAMAIVAVVLVLLNRLIWPAVADFLYFRHAHSGIRRMHRMSPTRAHEMEIATAGGVSGIAVFFGIATGGVLALLLWSAVDPGKLRLFEEVAATDVPAPDTSPVAALPPTSPAENGAATTPAPPPATQSKWVITRSGLRNLGTKVNTWLDRAPPGTDPTQLTMTRLRVDVGVTDQELLDGWGTAVHYIPAKDGFQFVSAGPDQLFGTIDDIPYRQLVKP